MLLPTIELLSLLRALPGSGRPWAILGGTLLIAASAIATAASAPSSDKLLDGDFYRIELIVFMRLNVTEANTAEQLTALDAGRLPAKVAGFTSFDGERDYPFELEPDTRRMLQRSERLFGATVSWRDTLTALLPATSATVASVSTELGLSALAGAQASGQQGTGLIERTTPVDPDGNSNLTMPAMDPEQALQEAIAAYEQELTRDSFAWRSNNLALLSEVAASINRSRNYRLLLAGSWHQHVPERKAALPLLIQTGTRYGDLYQLEGTISVGLARYLHVGADFWYYEPELGAYTEALTSTPAVATEATGIETAEAAPEGAAAPAAELAYRTVLPPGDYRMHLSEKRRMRSAELHYLDHPKLGVLVRIDPVPLSEAVISAYERAREAR